MRKLVFSFSLDVMYYLSVVVTGGEGVLESGKLATSLPPASERIEPNGWSGDS